MGGFSKYFTFDELTESEQHKKLVVGNRQDALSFILAGKRLSKLLESIRSLLGNRPMEVTSGFRNDALNLAVGSTAKNSSHQRFEAADIKHSELTPKEAFEILKSHRDQLGDLRKVILEEIHGKSWLHIEVKMDSKEPQMFFTTTNGSKYTRVL